jgi:tetratricopeptide (TPR) repeat protein
MAIKGSLKEASLPDVLQLLSAGAKTGCLSVTNRRSLGQVFFEDGRITYASVLNRQDRLGDVLVQENVITREKLDRAIEEQGKVRDGRRLGEILRDKWLIDQDTLQHYVERQIREAVLHLFTWRQGTFLFEPGKAPDREQILVSINPETLLLEGAKRIDEWSLIEKKIPSLELVFTLDADRSGSISTLDLAPEQERILQYLDGKHSAWDIVDRTAMSEFEVGKALYGLLSAGLVRRRGRRERESGLEELQGRVEEHRNLGVALYRTAMFDEAVRELKQALELSPDALDAEFYLGLVALRQGRIGAAERQFKEILDRGSNQASVFNNLALVMDRLGKTAEAVSLLDEAATKTNGHPKLYLTRAAFQIKLRDPAGAKCTLEEYADVALYDLSPLYYSVRAMAEAMLGDIDAAAQVVEEGVKKYPTCAALANNAGVIEERKGDLARARELYIQALRHDAGLAQASKNLGDLLYRDGRYDDAASAYERTVRADPELGDDVYARLGNVYYRRRDRKRAIDMWSRALKLNPSNEVVRTNLEFVRGPASDG